MTISLFSPICSSFQNPLEKCAGLRNTTQYFNWGQKAYEINLYKGGSILEVSEVDSKPSLAGLILRVISYITVIIPLIMLVGLLIYRHVNVFQIGSDLDIFGNIGKHNISQFTVKQLLNVGITSKHNKTLVVGELIDRINNNIINPSDLGIHTITNLVDYFGDRCSEIVELDLSSFSEVDDLEINKLAESFPNIVHLSLNNAKITRDSVDSISKMVHLENLNLTDCSQLTDISFVRNFQKITSLNLSGCSLIADFSPLKDLQSLTTLNLSRCPQITKTDFLENLGITSLDLSGCTQISDFSKLHELIRLGSLNLSDCKQIMGLNLLEGLKGLTTLNLSGCSQIRDFTPLKDFKELTILNLSTGVQIHASTICVSGYSLSDLTLLQEMHGLTTLSLSGCTEVKDLKPLQSLQRLTSLDLSWCKGITDLSPLQSLQELTDLNLSHCEGITDLEPLQGLPNLKSLNLSGSINITDFNKLQSLEGLTSLNLNWCVQITDDSFLNNLKGLTTLNRVGFPSKA